MAERYLMARPDGGRESPEEMIERVAGAVASAEARWGGEAVVAEMTRRFAALMGDGLFLPNSPTLMNAGRRLGQLSACFVIPVGDSLESIFGALRQAALIHKSGGGTGFDFSALRPAGDSVDSTRGVSSGPLSFIGVFDAATEAVKQGGARRGANMAVLGIDHPDVLAFIEAKTTPGTLPNFNLSVMIPDEFMEALDRGAAWPLRNPRTGAVCGAVDAAELFDRLVRAAHASGEPGVLFARAINRANPTPGLGAIRATNPCGEQPLLPYESCNLGSLVLPAFLRGGAVDFAALEDAAALALRFLDDVVEVNRFPLEQVRRATRLGRKVGLGVMGLADVFLGLGLPYDSDEARALGGRIMEAIGNAARGASRELGRQRGDFPAFGGSTLARGGEAHMRNATVTTVAPTGSLSLLMGCSAGIEPLFALAFRRQLPHGRSMEALHSGLAGALSQMGLDSGGILEHIIANGRVGDLPGVPAPLAAVLATAHEVAPRAHLEMQAVFQRRVDNGVSKTLNLPAGAEPDVVAAIFKSAHAMGLKGVTVFRDGCRGEQVITAGYGAAPGAAARRTGRSCCGPDCQA